MPLALDMADGLRDFGLDVVEEPGWQSLGSSLFGPLGVVLHHTVSNPPADAPSLGVVTHGRPDLAPPLCNVLLARSGTCHCVAAGRANHAGSGSWMGLVGNSMVWGIEAENTGTGSELWTYTQMDAYIRCTAALLAIRGRDSRYACRHAEWAGPRKSDAFGPWWDGHRWETDASLFRTLTQQAINSGGQTLDMDLIGKWMQEQANRVIQTLTGVVNGRRSDSMFLVTWTRKDLRLARGAYLWTGGDTCRPLPRGEGGAALLSRSFNARTVRLSVDDMKVFLALVPPAAE